MGKELVRGKVIEYVKMNFCHAQQVADLEARCFSTPWSERSIISEITNPLSLWIVAVKGESVVGYVGSQSVLGEADMMNLAVEPSCRRQGIAERLVGFLIEQLKDSQVHCLTLEVRVSNEAAIALYEKMGFAEAGRRPGYYTNPREDALILRKEWEL